MQRREVRSVGAVGLFAPGAKEAGADHPYHHHAG